MEGTRKLIVCNAVSLFDYRRAYPTDESFDAHNPKGEG